VTRANVYIYIYKSSTGLNVKKRVYKYDTNEFPVGGKRYAKIRAHCICNRSRKIVGSNTRNLICIKLYWKIIRFAEYIPFYSNGTI